MNLGTLGEKRAEDYLKTLNYSILVRNFRTKVGEIDIICRKDDTIVFIEVKSRIGGRYGKPYESVNYHKINHLKKAIYFYLLKNNFSNLKMRADVISIEFSVDRKITNFKHFENIDLKV